jgi:hypothetical protein
MSTIKSSTTTTTAYSVEADTTGALVIQTGATPTTAVTVAADQSVTFAQAANLPNTFGFKNRIINGAMVIDQRNAGASVTPIDGEYTLDRWRSSLTQTGKYTVQQTTGNGFGNSICVTSTSAYSVLTGDFFALQQMIEGFNFYDLQWGTANASSVTLSFVVKSSLTGTFGGSLVNSAVNRSYPFTYTISSANTWETKTVTIAGDTSGTWIGATNGIGCRVYFNLGAGSTYSGTAGAWAGAAYTSATGAVSVVGTNAANLFITGVQLEKGSTATSFDYRPYGTELVLCQRYYETFVNSFTQTVFYDGYTSTGGATAGLNIPYRVTKRATPTMATVGTFTVSNTSGSLFFNTGVDSFLAGFATLAAGRVFWWAPANGGFTASSEL